MHPRSHSGEWTVQMRALVRAEALVQALGVEGVHAQAEQVQAWVQAQAQAAEGERVQSWLQAQAQRQEEERAQTWVQAPQVQARARAQAEAQVRADALMVPWTRVRVGGVHLEGTLAEAQTDAHTVTYGEVLADSKLMDIICSIKINNRHSLARDLWSSRHKYWWFIQMIVPITRLPSELLQQILLDVIDNANDSPSVLMRVSKLWHTIVTGIWASLKLGTTTPKNAVTSKLERNQWLLDVLVDTDIDRGHFAPSEGAYQAIFAALEVTTRWRSFVVESFPAQADLSEHLVSSDPQQYSDPVMSRPVMSRLRTFKIKRPCEMSPLLERLLRILGTSASGELTTVEIHSANVISLLVPTYPSIFHSVTVLSLDAPGLRNPVDLLPHLHQLEALTASHLPLLVHHDDVDLPLVHTLRYLTLKAVSIQWMSGRTFHVLESCTIIFPLRPHVLHTFSSTLPNCKVLTFQGHPLDILDGVSAHNLTHLSVISSCPHKLRGSQQLVRFSSQVLQESRLPPRILHISIEAMGWAWAKALPFMSTLEELVIETAQPSSLGAKVLQSLVVHPVHADKLNITATHGGGNTPACPSLKRFGLRYRRWLRPSEHFDLIPEFMSIIWSRQQSKFSLQSFRIWKGSEQKDPLELIEGSWISVKGFEHLANDGASKGEDWLQLVVSRLVESLFKPCPLPHAPPQM